jgi:hypothetical protein
VIAIGAEQDERGKLLDVVRRVAFCINLAARQLGLEVPSEVSLDGLIDRVLRAAQGGGLEPQLYSIVWHLRPRGELHA